VSTAQLSVQLRRLWLETYAPGQQSFVLSLRLPHRNAFRAPWDGDSGTLGCNGGTCGAPWTCLPSRRECELGPGDVSQIAVGGVGMCVADACCTGRALLHVVLALHGCLWGGRVVSEKGAHFWTLFWCHFLAPAYTKWLAGARGRGRKAAPFMDPLFEISERRSECKKQMPQGAYAVVATQSVRPASVECLAWLGHVVLCRACCVSPRVACLATPYMLSQRVCVSRLAAPCVVFPARPHMFCYALHAPARTCMPCLDMPRVLMPARPGHVRLCLAC